MNVNVDAFVFLFIILPPMLSAFAHSLLIFPCSIKFECCHNFHYMLYPCPISHLLATFIDVNEILALRLQYRTKYVLHSTSVLSAARQQRPSPAIHKEALFSLPSFVEGSPSLSFSLSSPFATPSWRRITFLADSTPDSQHG